MEMLLPNSPTVRRIEGEAAFNAWDSLLQECFPVPPGDSFFDDFPVWRWVSSDLCFRLGIEERPGRLLASAACRLAEMALPGRPQATVALIGGVATRAEARGRGYASQLLRLSLEWAENRGSVAAFLWSGRGDLYERLGFRPMGTQVRVPLASFVLARPHEGLEIRAGLTAAMERELLERRTGGILLRRRDLTWIRAHRNVEWQGLYRGRELLAYAAIGKGIDLPFCVHEWGGRAELLAGFFSELGLREPRLQLLACPAQLARLGFAELPSASDPLVYARALSQTPECLSSLEKRADFWFWGLDGC